MNKMILNSQLAKCVKYNINKFQHNYYFITSTLPRILIFIVTFN